MAITQLEESVENTCIENFKMLTKHGCLNFSNATSTIVKHRMKSRVSLAMSRLFNTPWMGTISSDVSFRGYSVLRYVTMCNLAVFFAILFKPMFFFTCAYFQEVYQ